MIKLLATILLSTALVGAEIPQDWNNDRMYSEKYGYRFYDVAVDSVYAWMPCPKPYKEADCYEKQT